MMRWKIIVGLIASIICVSFASLRPDNVQYRGLSSSHNAHKCIQDELLNRFPHLRHKTVAHQNYLPHKHARMLQEANQKSDEKISENELRKFFQPMRITVDYIGLDGTSILSSEQRNFIQKDLIPEATDYLSKLLTVRPVGGTLFAHRQCTHTFRDDLSKCVAYSSPTTCASIGDRDEVVIPEDYLGKDLQYSTSGSVTTLAEGNGVPGSDFHLFVTAEDTQLCSQSTLAYASSCQRDQYDRPTFARVNFCPQAISTQAADASRQRATALHEIMHAVGFSADSWPLFRVHGSMRPRTPRNEQLSSLVTADNIYQFTCRGASVQFAMPDASTVGFYAARGMKKCDNPAEFASNGDCVAHVVTPRAVEMAKQHFGCDSLQGPELENQPTTSCSLLGSHWEQRLFDTELMAPYAGHVMKISAVTLALLEDSGWYLANYTLADSWLKNRDYGFQQGCQFATQKCVEPASNADTAKLQSNPHNLQVKNQALYDTMQDSKTKDNSASDVLKLSAVTTTTPQPVAPIHRRVRNLPKVRYNAKFMTSTPFELSHKNIAPFPHAAGVPYVLLKQNKNKAATSSSPKAHPVPAIPSMPPGFAEPSKETIFLTAQGNQLNSRELASSSDAITTTGVIGVGSPQHFCTSTSGFNGGQLQCTVDRRAVGACDIGYNQDALPEQYRYFSSSDRLGATSIVQADYCPVVRAYSNRICSDARNNPTSGGDYMGQHFGSGSMCVDSTLAASPVDTEYTGAGCYSYTCTEVQSFNSDQASSGSDQKRTYLLIDIKSPANSDTSWETINCTKPGEEHTVHGFYGKIRCPDPVTFCSRKSIILTPDGPIEIEPETPGQGDNGNGPIAWFGDHTTVFVVAVVVAAVLVIGSIVGIVLARRRRAHRNEIAAAIDEEHSDPTGEPEDGEPTEAYETGLESPGARPYETTTASGEHPFPYIYQGGMVHGSGSYPALRYAGAGQSAPRGSVQGLNAHATDNLAPENQDQPQVSEELSGTQNAPHDHETFAITTQSESLEAEPPRSSNPASIVVKASSIPSSNTEHVCDEEIPDEVYSEHSHDQNHMSSTLEGTSSSQSSNKIVAGIFVPNKSQYTSIVHYPSSKMASPDIRTDPQIESYIATTVV